jgi:hypothetical protein
LSINYLDPKVHILDLTSLQQRLKTFNLSVKKWFILNQISKVLTLNQRLEI